MTATLSPFPSIPPGIATSSRKSGSWNLKPFPKPAPFVTPRPRPGPLPACPVADSSESGVFPPSWPPPLSELPSSGAPSSQPLPRPLLPTLFTADEPPASLQTPAPDSGPGHSPPAEDFTDDDLREAFGPIVEHAVRKAVYAKENGIDTYLEPMLRATIRRALAEYAPASRPFQPPGTFDRFNWHVQALFTSRTYEDIYFERTRRFQVEEVFLLDGASLALVSFASCDPARHSSVRRVFNTVQRLALQLRDETGRIRQSFDLADRRTVIARQGTHVVLAAIIRGTPGELVTSDLEFALRRIEDHFRDKFQQEGSALLYAIQPFLEDCLLIQSPASAS